MQFIALLPAEAVTLLIRAADQAPKPEDVTAGWIAFAVFLLLGAAVALLGFSLAKHLRKAQAAQDAGVFDADTKADTNADVRDS